jgi:hypothetical protein
MEENVLLSIAYSIFIDHRNFPDYNVIIHAAYLKFKALQHLSLFAGKGGGSPTTVVIF